MLQELILIRHGKAEELSGNMSDSDRKLTRKGERELKAMFSVLGPYLAGRKKVKLWSSKLERAMQTAALLSREMGKAHVTFQEFISGGDLGSLTKKAAGTSGTRLLVIVGHEPHLSSWTEEITGVRVDFRKGAALSIKLDTVKPLKGKLQWQLNPEQYAAGKTIPQLTFPAEREGKPHFDEKGAAGEEMNSLFLHCLREIAEAGSEFMNSPDDPEAIHKYRVKIRQFRSVLSFVKPEVGKKEYERLQTETRELAGKFTYLRQLDVMSEKLGEGYPALLGVLKEEREKEKKSVYEDLAADSAAPLFFELLQWIEKDPFSNSKKSELPLVDFVDEGTDRWIERFRKGLRNVDSKDVKGIHALRIQGKKLRYLMALMEPVLKEKKAELIPKFKEMQDMLGQICDIQIDIPVLDTLKSKYSSPEVVREIDQVEELKKKEAEGLIAELPREIE